MAEDGLTRTTTMTIASASSGNGAWSPLIKNKPSPVNCRKGCVGTPHVKDTIAGVFCGAVAT